MTHTLMRGLNDHMYACVCVCVCMCIYIYVYETLGTVLDAKEALAVLVLSYGAIEELMKHTYIELLAGHPSLVVRSTKWQLSSLHRDSRIFILRIMTECPSQSCGTNETGSCM